MSNDIYAGFNGSAFSWYNIYADPRHREKFTYDANGNIARVWRTGYMHTNPVMDSLTYYYTPGTNRLDHIRDSVPSGKYGPTVDIKNQSPGNYQYNAIGNLVSSVGYGTNNIKWNVYGKIEEVNKQQFYNSGTRFHHYYYDPSGNRVGVAHRAVTMHYFTWYVRDAQGNVMAVYQVNEVTGASQGTLRLTEHHMYGSSRLGIIRRDMDVDQPRLAGEEMEHLGNGYLVNFTRGRKPAC